MGAKYIVTFPDAKVDATTWHAYIYVAGYGGATSYITGIGEPIFHELLSTEDNKLDPVKGSSVEINLRSRTANKFIDDIAVKSEQDVFVVIKKAGVNYWKGFYSAEDYGEAWLPIYEVSLTFVDGLGKLKDQEFSDNGVLYYGKKTLLQIIHICLEKTSIGLDLIEGVNIYETNHNDGYTDSPLNQTYVDCEAFLDDEEPMNCYDVLCSILKSFGCRMWQENYDWYMVPVVCMDGEYYYRRWTDSETYDSGGTVDNSITINGATTAAASRNVFLNKSGWRQIDKAYSKVVITQDLGLRDNQIRNGNLIHFSGDTPSNFTGGSHYSGVYYDDFRTNHEKAIHWPTGMAFDYYDNLIWLKKFDTILTTLSLKFSFTFFTNPYLPIDLFWSIRINGTGGSYYLRDDGTWSSTVILYQIHSEDNDNGWGDTTFSIDTEETVPDVGDYCYITITLFRPGCTSGTPLDVYFTEVKLELTNIFGTQPEDNKFTYEINSKNNRVLEHEVSLGDTLTQAGTNILWENNQFFYDKILYYLSGLEYIPTSEWHTQGNSENKTLISLLLDHIVSLYNYNSWILTGEIQGHLTPGVLLLDNLGRGFIVGNYTHNLKTGTFDVRLLQIKRADESYILSEEGDIIETEAGDYVEIE